MQFVLVPGAWAGGWIWDAVAEHLRGKGHQVHQLTLSGLGENEQPESVGLSTHVEDVESYICTHDLTSVVLVGHSYAGVVVGQVASRRNVAVKHSIFVEAFLPVSGQSLLEVSGLQVEQESAVIERNQGMWPTPGREELASQPKLNAALIDLLVARQASHPGSSVTEPARLEAPLSEISATFIATEGWLSSSREQHVLDELKNFDTWQFREIYGGHWPMLLMPKELSEQMHACLPVVT